MKKKRTFQILDEMNQEDGAKGTRMVKVGYDLISVDKVKGGCKVAIGMPEPALYDIMSQKGIPILVLVDKDEYFKREKIEETKIAKTGIELIAKERAEQPEKHGRTVQFDVDTNKDGQLLSAIMMIIANVSFIKGGIEMPKEAFEDLRPEGWGREACWKILDKSVIGQLRVLGAFAAAEIDRILATEDYETCENCENVFKSDDMHSDGEGCYFCKECYTALAPVWKAERDELLKKGEIEKEE